MYHPAHISNLTTIEVFRFIAAKIDERGTPPALFEIARRFRLPLDTVIDHTIALRRANWIDAHHYIAEVGQVELSSLLLT